MPLRTETPRKSVISVIIEAKVKKIKVAIEKIESRLENNKKEMNKKL